MMSWEQQEKIKTKPNQPKTAQNDHANYQMPGP